MRTIPPENADRGTSPEDASPGPVRGLSLCFAGGALGALVNSLVVWVLGQTGATHALGIDVAPSWTWGWIRTRLLWGGLWGFGFYPLIHGALANPWASGLLISLFPTANQLFVVFPLFAGAGVLGLANGSATPVLVFAVNLVWGWTAAFWIRAGLDPRSG